MVTVPSLRRAACCQNRRVSDFAQLADEVAAAFGLGRALAPMRCAAGGEQATIWRLETTLGSFAVRQPRRGFEVRADGVDIAFQEAVFAQTGMLMPRPVRRPGGELVVSVGDHVVRVATWVDLLPPDTGLDARRVGELLAALHQVDFTAPGDVDPWYWAPVGEQAWQSHAERLAAAGAPFADAFRAAVPGLVELERLLEPPRVTRICHCDLWADNLLRTPNGDLCVIDWDNSGPADPSHELGMLMYEFGLGDAERMRALYQAYVDAGGPARLTRPGQLTMVIAQFGHFWEQAAECWLDLEATDGERQHQEDRVAELSERPLTVEGVGAILRVA